jgi:hypothetical protein
VSSAGWGVYVMDYRDGGVVRLFVNLGNEHGIVHASVDEDPSGRLRPIFEAMHNEFTLSIAQDHLHSFYAAVEKVMREASARCTSCSQLSQRELCVRRLRADLMELTQSMLPDELSKLLGLAGEHAGMLLVECASDSIPWEYLYLTSAGRLLGEQYLVLRLPTFAVGVPVPLKVHRPGSSSGRTRIFAFEVPRGKPGARLQKDDTYAIDLDKNAPGLLRVAKELTDAELRDALMRDDIVVIVTHAKKRGVVVRGEGTQFSLSPALLQTMPSEGVALLVLAVCDQARPRWNKFEWDSEKTVSLGYGFAMGGERLMVSSLTRVPVSVVGEIVRCLRRALHEDGLSVGDAVRWAKEAGCASCTTLVGLTAYGSSYERCFAGAVRELSE